MAKKPNKAEASFVKMLETEMSLISLLHERVTTAEARIEDLRKSMLSHQEMLVEHQRVLRILFNEKNPNDKPN